MAKRPLIDPHNLPANNRVDPSEQREVINRIPLAGGVKKKKKKGFAFDVSSITNSLYDSVILPAVKAVIEDLGNNALSMMLYRNDDNRELRRPGGRGRGGYSNSYDLRNGKTRASARNVSTNSALEIDEICFTKYRDAEEVLARMIEYIAQYQWVSVAAFYDLVGVTPNYMHDRYGWTTLRGVKILRDSQGFFIDFPEPMYEA